jgi:VWFA-related protein
MALSKREFIRILLGGLSAPRSAYPQAATFSSDVNVVNVFASVRDSRGIIQRDLNKDSFSLEVDGRHQSINYFADNLALSIAMLIDTSGSMQTMLDEEIGVIRLLAAHLLRGERKGNEASLLSFSKRVVLWHDFTSAPLLFLSTLNRLRNDKYEDDDTNLFDAIALTSSNILKSRAGRRAIVLISDCVDTASRIGLGGAITRAQRADVSVYALRMFDRDRVSKFLGNDHLFAPAEMEELQQRLDHDFDRAWSLIQIACERTGGRAVSTFGAIEEELENQYSLGFNLTAETGKPGPHKMSITTTRADLTVRSKDTYYI